MILFRQALTYILAAVTLTAGPSLAEPQEVVPQKILSTDMAMTIAQGALEKCRADGYRITIAIIDSSNILKVFIRDDGSGIVSVDLSRRKAFTALAFRRTSAEQLQIWRAAAPPVYIPADGAVGAGGVPIKSKDDVIGAIGVSGAPGGDKDEACADAGIAKVASKLK